MSRVFGQAADTAIARTPGTLRDSLAKRSCVSKTMKTDINAKLGCYNRYSLGRSRNHRYRWSRQHRTPHAVSRSLLFAMLLHLRLNKARVCEAANLGEMPCNEYGRRWQW